MFGSGGAEPPPLRAFSGERRARSEGPRRMRCTSSDFAKLQDYYDGAIRYADDEIGRLVAAARRASGERDLVVVVTSGPRGRAALRTRAATPRESPDRGADPRAARVLVFSRASPAAPRWRAWWRTSVDLLPTLSKSSAPRRRAKRRDDALVPMLRGETDTVDQESYHGRGLLRVAQPGQLEDGDGGFHRRVPPVRSFVRSGRERRSRAEGPGRVPRDEGASVRIRGQGESGEGGLRGAGDRSGRGNDTQTESARLHLAGKRRRTGSGS